MLMFAILGSAIPAYAAEGTSVPSKVIHVVYDDSGSMFTSGGVDVDTWCQAKYSMEVFAAMLGESDQMAVYYMSDYESSTAANARIVLNGSDGASTNVAKIHNETTTAGNTPFNSVRKAYADLLLASADEKWLVVLTDGEFQGVNDTAEIDTFFVEKESDINVMYLSMGSNADKITTNENQGIYCIGADTSSDILTEITNICSRIFDFNKLDVNVSSKTISFDVPMGELVVFAQGANVSIAGIVSESGALIQSSSVPVEVSYSECDASNYNNAPDKDLLGQIATFKDDFSSGDYTIDASGAETIEIYYKPNVEIAAYLVDEDGTIVSDQSNLEAGTYTISFGFVKTGTNEAVPASSLLGDVSYNATVATNGNVHENSYTSGDTIELEEGSLVIDVTATYLEYNEVSTHLAYSLYSNKSIEFAIVDNPYYVIDSDGFEDSSAIFIQATIDGATPTQAQWDAMEIPTVQFIQHNLGFELQLGEVEKTQELGVFSLSPILPSGSPSTGTYSDSAYTISYYQQVGEETWQGESEEVLQLSDSRSWWERNWDLFVKLAISLLILLLIMGYLPCFKYYLPKSLKKKPYIKCIPSEPGEKRKDRNGVVEKKLITTLVPYMAQKGTIKYVPKGVTGCPIMAVKGIKRRRMTLTNVKAFAGKEHITFDGEAIKKETKKFETGAGVSIRVKRTEWTYICSPNQTQTK